MRSDEVSEFREACGLPATSMTEREATIDATMRQAAGLPATPAKADAMTRNMRVAAGIRADAGEQDKRRPPVLAAVDEAMLQAAGVHARD